MNDVLFLPRAIWIGLMVVQVVLMIVTILKSLGGKKKTLDDLVDTVQVECADCRWKGEVMRLRKKCPMCGSDNFL
ncbi:MAG TPA: hypothetical protein PKW95_13080 [bacterium]|nr:hypothetical protein [bacterium]